MHPLLDRRDLTEQRRPAAAPSSERAELASLAAELAITNELLMRLLTQERAEIVQLCVSDREPPEDLIDNFPVPGARRRIVRRSSQGGTFQLAANTPLLILPANESRLGGLIANAGAGAVTLILNADQLTPGSATPLSAGPAQIKLPAAAAGAPSAWNMLLGQLLWCGNVIAVADAATSVTVAEV